MANPDSGRQIGAELGFQSVQSDARPHRFTVHPETGALVPPGNPKTLKRLGVDVGSRRVRSSWGVESLGPDVQQDLGGYDHIEIEHAIEDGEAHGYSAYDPKVETLADEWLANELATEKSLAPNAVEYKIVVSTDSEVIPEKVRRAEERRGMFTGGIVRKNQDPRRLDRDREEIGRTFWGDQEIVEVPRVHRGERVSERDHVQDSTGEDTTILVDASSKQDSPDVKTGRVFSWPNRDVTEHIGDAVRDVRFNPDLQALVAEADFYNLSQPSSIGSDHGLVFSQGTPTQREIAEEQVERFETTLARQEEASDSPLSE